MAHWQQYTHEEQLVLLQETASNKHIPEAAVEKDWWVTTVLHGLFQTSWADYLLFKGGTSLSKGWDLIHRFSEDIDLAVSPDFIYERKNDSNSQLKKLKKESRKKIINDLAQQLEQYLLAYGLTDFEVVPESTRINEQQQEVPIDSNKDPTVINVMYNSILDSSSQIDYIQTKVKIEISCLSMPEPSEQREISSLISDHFSETDDDMTSTIKTVLPSRTFLEKIFLLQEEFQKDNPRSMRMTRHLYDIEKIMGTEHGQSALQDKSLYKDIVKHRKDTYQLGYVDYDKHHPSTINIIPSEEIKSDWEKDYTDMTNTFIYGDTLEYQNLISKIQGLQNTINGLDIDKASWNI